MKTQLFFRIFSMLIFLSGLLNTNLLSEEKVMNQLTEAEQQAGWKLLFDGKTSTGWKSSKKESFPERGWRIEDGTLTVMAGERGGDIVTVDQYSNFELSLEFKLTPGANSGIKYFVQPETGLGLEFQVLDDSKHPDANMGVAGNRTLSSLYDLIPAENRKINPVGEWNHARIVVQGSHVEHWLNGVKVLEYNRHSQCFRALIQKSKYKDIENFAQHPQGHILLQDHGDTVSYRNIKIRVP